MTAAATINAREPFVIRRAPRTTANLRAVSTDRLFVSLLVVVPETTLLRVVAENFQFLSGLSSRSRKRLLLLFGAMEEELTHHGPVAVQVTLECSGYPGTARSQIFFVDALLRQLLSCEKFRMHPYDEGLLVVAAIEDPDPPPSGRPLTRQEIVVFEFLAGRGT